LKERQYRYDDGGKTHRSGNRELEGIAWAFDPKPSEGFRLYHGCRSGSVIGFAKSGPFSINKIITAVEITKI
jgi:hypothetical protein